MRRSDSAIILFTLSPGDESLRKSIGTRKRSQAARFFDALLKHLISVCRSLEGVDLLVTTPRKEYAAGDYLPQRGDSFGDSLKLAVEDAFALGYRRVLVIGNDAPEISPSYLTEAFEALKAAGSRGAVMGPARDGGYAALGLTRYCAAAFEDIPWGSSNVADRTAEKLEDAGFTVVTLGALEDIDDRNGLMRFARRARVHGLWVLGHRASVVLAGGCCSPKPAVLAPKTVRISAGNELRAPPQTAA